MSYGSSTPPKVIFVEASTRPYAFGSATGRQVIIKLEDHPVKNPIAARLIDVVEDLDLRGKKWYVARLDEAAPLFLDPVSEILLFPQGAMDHTTDSRPAYDSEGRQISYIYANPLDEMLLNEHSLIKYVVAQIATLQDPAVLRDKRLIHRQIRIYPRATLWRSPLQDSR